MIDRSEHAEAVQTNTRRVKKHPEVYAARQKIIEHIFGTIKLQRGYDHILLKELRKNDGLPSHEASATKGDFGLIYLIYNFRRIMNILGVEGMNASTHSTGSVRRLLASILLLHFDYLSLILVHPLSAAQLSNQVDQENDFF